MSERQESDYLWDRTGVPDDEAERLEALLGPLAPAEPRIPVRRRRWLVPLVVALLTFAFVFVALPNRAVPSRIAGIFHDNFPGEIGVRGGTRVEYEVEAESPDLALTNQVADELRQRGANVVFVRPGSIIIDLVGVEPAGVRAWSRGIGAVGKLAITAVEENTALMRDLYAAASDDPRAAALGIDADIDIWRHDPSSRRFEDFYLIGPDKATVAGYLAELMKRDPRRHLPEGTEFAFETVRDRDGGVRGVRSYVVRSKASVTQRDIADAAVVYDPSTGWPGILVDLTLDGGRRFGELTQDSVGHKVAILLDDAVQSAPVVMSPIRGGRINISMGGDGSDAGEAEGLAAAFRQGTLAAPVSLVSVSKVEPVLSGASITAARALFALPFALFTLFIALGIARFAPRIEPAVFALRGGERTANGWWVRLVVTLAGAAAAGLSVLAPLPGVERETVRNLLADSGQFSMFALGLRPVLSAFILVEVVAVLIPSWRRARVSGPSARAKLGVATALLSLVLAGLQAWFLVTWMDSFGVNPGAPALIAHDAFWPRATIFLSLVGGTVLLIVLASVINRRGLGNGYVAVILGGMGYEAYQLLKGYLDVGLSATTLGWLVLFTAATVGVTNLVLRLRVRGGASRLLLQLPTCGYVPLAWTAGLFAFAGIVATLHLELPIAWLFRADGSMSPWLFLGIAVVLSVVCSLLFSLPIRFESVVTMVSPKPAPRFSSAVFWTATAASTVALLGLAGLYLLGTGKLPRTAPDVLWLAIATAGIMDLVADARARRRNPSLVAVWPIHRVQLSDVAIEALANRGIDAHAQGLYFRKLFYFFAPYAPILVMVPEDRAEEAREALESMLGTPS